MDTKLQALRAPRTQEGPRLRQNVQTAQSPPAQRSPAQGYFISVSWALLPSLVFLHPDAAARLRIQLVVLLPSCLDPCPPQPSRGVPSPCDSERARL